MTEFYKQYFCPDNEVYSVIIEDDGKVCYAYLLTGEDIVGDIWLYNQQITPESTNWKDQNNMPFLNPKKFVGENIKPIDNENEISIKWDYKKELSKVELFVRDESVAILKIGALPG